MKQNPLFHQRPVCIVALGVLLGALLGPMLLPGDCLAAGLAVLLLAACAFLCKKRRFALLFVFVSAALFRTGTLDLPTVPTGEYTVSGIVATQPDENAYGDTVLLLHVTLDGAETPARVMAYLDLVVPPVPGQRITFPCSIQPAKRENSYYRYLGVAATARQRGECKFSAPPAGATGLLNQVRASLRNRVDALFPENGSLIAAFLLGDDRNLTDDTYARFQAAGVGHLLAVSGLHVSILAAAVCCCIRFSGLWTRFSLMFAFLLLYCILTSFQPSVVRASVMFLAAALAVPLKRNTDGASSLSLAFVLIVLFNPFVLYYVGFQLSFLAVYGIVTLSPLLKKPLHRLGSSASAAISGTLAASIGTLPSVCRYFGAVPVAAMFVNVLVLPLFAFMLVPAFAAVALSYLSFPLSRLLAVLSGFVLNGLLDTINACAGGLLTVPAPGRAALFLWLFSMLAASAYPQMSKKLRAACSLLLLATSLLAWPI